MLDQYSRVTVVGTRKRADVTVPSAAPVGEYVGRLAELCGQDSDDVFPPAWSLAAPGAAPIAIHESLAEAGIVDGAVLYLTDLAGDPALEPAVEDIAELVAEGRERARAAQPRRGAVVAGLALVWLAVTAAVLAARAGGPGAAAGLAVTGLALLGTAWLLGQRRTTVPAALPLGMAVTAAACVAVACGLLATGLAGPGYFWIGIIAGANLGVVMAFTAVPDAVLAALQLHAVAAALVCPLLILLQVGPAQVAAAAVVLAVGLLGLSKWLAATITAWAERPAAPSVGRLLGRADWLLTALIAGPLLALTAGMLVLARSPGWFPLLLAAVAAVTLLVRTQQAGTFAETVGFGAAALTGVFAVVAELAGRWAGTGGVATVLLLGGCVVLGAGLFVTVVRMPIRGGTSDVSLGGAAAAGRRSAAEVIGMLCHLAVAPLAMGVFGVYTELLAMGRDIVS
ncbi:EsaB/YukD family protein [Dactylosporangium sp. CA-152071]|uniref:EsaB/YukD family protein n=1 Tax=Dactylosporangium sp. CA-152071 TaxID=3239933 RepID=UPI003D8B2FBD